MREDLAENDDLISNIYLPEAMGSAFIETQRQLVYASYQYLLDNFPSNVIELPVAPVVQVASITYADISGAVKTVPASNYIVDTGSDPARISLPFGTIWPVILPQAGAVKINFSAGYVTPYTVDIAANTIAFNWKPLVVGDTVRVSNSGGMLPAPLKPRTDYYIQAVVSPGVYRLADSLGGPAISLADTGSGLNFIGQTGVNESQGEIPGALLAWLLLKTETIYSYRGGLINTPGSIITKNPYMDRLLDPYRRVLQ